MLRQLLVLSPDDPDRRRPLPAGTAFPEAGASTDELLAQIHADQRRQEAELEATDPEQAVQLKLQHQLVNATMMSNMLTMRHQAAMAIVNNFKA